MTKKEQAARNDALIGVAEGCIAKVLVDLKSTPLRGEDLRRMQLVESALTHLQMWKLG